MKGSASNPERPAVGASPPGFRPYPARHPVFQELFAAFVILCLLATGCEQKDRPAVPGKIVGTPPVMSPAKNEPSTTDDEGVTEERRETKSPSSNRNRRAALNRKFSPTQGRNQSTQAGKVRILDGTPEEREWERGDGRLEQGAAPVSSLPYWKRNEISRIRKARHEIEFAGIREAEAVRTLPYPDQREWTRKWNELNKPSLDKLALEEQELLLKKRSPSPDPKISGDLLERLAHKHPQLSEADLAVIDHLLPSDEDLRSTSTLDDPTRRLWEAYQILASRFPNSATRDRNLLAHLR